MSLPEFLARFDLEIEIWYDPHKSPAWDVAFGEKNCPLRFGRSPGDRTGLGDSPIAALTAFCAQVAAQTQFGLKIGEKKLYVKEFTHIAEALADAERISRPGVE